MAADRNRQGKTLKPPIRQLLFRLPLERLQILRILQHHRFRPVKRHRRVFEHPFQIMLRPVAPFRVRLPQKRQLRKPVLHTPFDTDPPRIAPRMSRLQQSVATGGDA